MTETTLDYRTTISAPADDVLAWHANPGALERLTPPWMDVRVLASEGGIAPGGTATVRVPVLGPMGFSWTLVHEASPDGPGFVDVQQDGPFAAWRHEHRFLPDGPDRSILNDRLTYELPFGALGGIANGRLAARMNELFAFRHRRTQIDIARHGAADLDRPLKIAITGASGLVGARLSAFLRAGGHEVFPLVRRRPRAGNEIFWSPGSGEIDAAALEGIDAVVHLAGVSIAGGRWTKARKTAIRDSRVEGTRLLARTLAELREPPRVFVSASAVGYYGDTGNTTLTERSPAGDGFLADVCESWESAALPAARAGIRVVHPRFGLVLAGEGGLLPILAKVFQTGVGGPLGNGKQFMSWIGLDDLVGILLEAIVNDGLDGPVNAVAPHPVSNRTFSKTLAAVLRRPALFPTPAPLMRLAAGQLADELILASQRAVPERLEEAGFRFAFPTLEQTLRHELGRWGGEAFAFAAPARRAAGARAAS